MVQKNKLAHLKDTIDFLNFNRDSSCTVPQFLSLFREHFDIGRAELEDW